METGERKQRDVAPRMTEEEREMARVAQRCLMEALDHSRAARIVLTTDRGEHPQVEVPPAALELIGRVLGLLSRGEAIALVPEKSEVTTVEAAHFLNVSRPFVIKEIDAGRLPHRMVGTHRRIAFSDLVAYGQGMRQKQEAALDRMADAARELGLDY